MTYQDQKELSHPTDRSDVKPVAKRKSWWRNEEGVVALEFALIVPVLFAFYFATIATFDAVRAASQASSAAMTITDLATRTIEMDDDIRDSLFATGNALMSRWGGTSEFSITITSINNPKEDDENDTPVDEKVIWSESNVEGQELTDDDLEDFDLPSMEEGDALVLVVVKGTYKPQYSILGTKSNFEIARNGIRRPRFVSEIQYID